MSTGAYNSGTCKKYVEILLSSGGEEMHKVKNLRGASKGFMTAFNVLL